MILHNFVASFKWKLTACECFSQVAEERAPNALKQQAATTCKFASSFLL